MKPKSSLRRNQLKPLILGGAIFGLSLSFATAATLNDAAQREWKSKDGKFSTQATMSSFDPATGQVMLKKENESIIKIPLSKLSPADQSYVKKHADSLTEKESSAESIKLYGVTWQPEMEDALKMAAGSEERPVMWFRVLGELDGGL